jgi:hypothetical protein
LGAGEGIGSGGANIISATDLMRPDWRFLACESDDPSLFWRTHSGLPSSALERLIRRPSLGCGVRH